MLKPYPLAAAFTLMLGVATTQADTLEAASTAMCEKVKQCALQQMNAAGQDVAPQMRAMIEQSINTMCDNMQSEFPAHTNHPLAAPAAACMRSMATLSCDQLINNENAMTPACTDYQKQVKQYGVDDD